MTSTELITALTTRRKELGISEAALSRETGIERRYLGRVLQGKHIPSLEVYRKICEALGMTIQVVYPVALNKI